MTIDEALIQIKSPDAETRRQAVIEVGKSKNPSMLPVLAEIYRGDPDANVRDMALKAGQYIRANMGPQAPTDPISTQTAAAVSAAPASELNRERAAGYMSQALDFQMRGNVLKSSELLGRAFDLNPALANDPLAQNLAADLTGQGPTAAARTFIDRNARAQFIASKGGRAVSVSSGEMAVEGRPTTWGGAILDLALYGLAFGAYVFIVMMIGGPGFVRMVASSSTVNGQPIPPESIQFLQNAGTIGVAIPLALGSAVVAFFALLIESSAIHLVAKTAQGGSGLLTSMIHKLAFFQIVLLPLSALITIPSLLTTDRTIDSILQLASFVLSIGALVYTCRLIGRNYSFSAGKGCVNLILTTVVLALFFFACSFVLSLAFAGLLNGASRGTGTF